MAAAAPAASGQPNRVAVITALGLTQILAWGSSYYLLAVLAPVVAADTGWPLPWIVGGLSVAARHHRGSCSQTAPFPARIN